MANELAPENMMSVDNDLRFGEMMLCTLSGTYPVMRYFLMATGAATIGSLIWYLVFGSYTALTVLFCSGIIDIAVVIALWKAFADQKTLMRQITTTITPQNIISRVNYSSSESRFDWARISGVRRIGRIIVYAIETDPPTSICIPFRCFSSRDDANRFLRLSYEYWREAQVRRHELGKCGTQERPGQFWIAVRIFLAVAIIGIVISMLESGSTWQPWALFALTPIVILLVRKADNGKGATLLANTALAKNDVAGALKATRAGLKQFPNNADLHVTAAYSLFNLGHFEEGLKHCHAAVAAHPSKALAYIGMGAGYREMADYDNALTAINKGLELEPNLAWAYVIRANIHVDFCMYDEALKDCDTAQSVEGKYYGHYSARAFVDYAREDFDAAEKNCQRAAELCDEEKRSKRDKAIVLALKGLILSRTNRHDEAFAAIDRAIEMDPDTASHYGYAGSIRLRAHKLEEAWSWFKMALQRKPSKRHLTSDYADMALNQYLLNNVEEAHRYADMALEIDPDARSLAGKRAALLRDKKYDELLKAFGYELSA
jgi:tetratricopeptide (TPR) repeat protein